MLDFKHICINAKQNKYWETVLKELLQKKNLTVSTQFSDKISRSSIFLDVWGSADEDEFSLLKLSMYNNKQNKYHQLAFYEYSYCDISLCYVVDTLKYRGSDTLPLYLTVWSNHNSFYM